MFLSCVLASSPECHAAFPLMVWTHSIPWTPRQTVMTSFKNTNNKQKEHGLHRDERDDSPNHSVSAACFSIWKYQEPGTTVAPTTGYFSSVDTQHNCPSPSISDWNWFYRCISASGPKEVSKSFLANDLLITPSLSVVSVLECSTCILGSIFHTSGWAPMKVSSEVQEDGG